MLLFIIQQQRFSKKYTFFHPKHHGFIELVVTFYIFYTLYAFSLPFFIYKSKGYVA
jgi:hypothetical protein